MATIEMCNKPGYSVVTQQQVISGGDIETFFIETGGQLVSVPNGMKDLDEELIPYILMFRSDLKVRV